MDTAPKPRGESILVSSKTKALTQDGVIELKLKNQKRSRNKKGRRIAQFGIPSTK